MSPGPALLNGAAFIILSLLVYIFGIAAAVRGEWQHASALFLAAVYLQLMGRWQTDVAHAALDRLEDRR